MFKIKISTQFSAAHLLRNYKGKCESLHGHNWKVEVLVANTELNPCGMVMDFSELKKMTSTALEELDHQNISDLEYFKDHNPSSEEIARYIFNKLKKEINEKKCQLSEVRVWETENSCAIYSEV
jgi:6-pyruvoyltetrahydropterin/6-carboxytetrahydropterin synthase